MHSYTSYFKSISGFFITLVILVLLEISLRFIPNLYFLEGTGSFFVYLKREVLETKNDFDIIVLGDSRSLSLMGLKKENGHPYSMYNFSLPAAGPFYFQYFLEKYLKNNSKPKLVVFAGDPANFNSSKFKKFNEDPKLWASYKHRLLNLFTYSETFQQYEGKELFFISKEYFASSFYIIRFREVLAGLVNSKLNSLLKFDFAIYQRNKIVADLINQNNGMINLGDFFIAPPGLSEKEKQNQLDNNKHENINLEPFDSIVEVCNRENLKLVILNIPKIEGLHETKFMKLAKKEFQTRAEKNPNVHYLEFPEMDYPVDFFGEAIHYSSKGEKKLNSDFLNTVVKDFYKIIEQ
jgi:hypothetical protein